MKKSVKILVASISCLLAAVLLVGLLFYQGILQLNNPSQNKYPVKGVDVSAYQGEIDWGVLSEGNISFAFIRLQKEVALWMRSSKKTGSKQWILI